MHAIHVATEQPPTPAIAQVAPPDPRDPIPMECDAPFLQVLGELPQGLNGTLYRNGPNPLFPTPGAHWFGGNGMLHAFTLREGRASYRNRWVRTARWQADCAAGRSVFDAFGRPAKPADARGQQPASGQGAGSAMPPAANEGVANTNIIAHAGRLLALEEAHLPFEVEPSTMARRGPVDFGGAIAGPFTAHPKTDPVTGELLFFGYGASGPLSAGMVHGVVDATGRVTHLERFEAPYAAMVHDFAVTSGHLLFPVFPLTASMPRARAGGPPFAWEPAQGTRIGVLRRGAPVAGMRWFEAEACFVFHVMNAWEEQDLNGRVRIFVDVMRSDEAPLFTYPDGRPTDPARSRARLCRWTFDLAGAGKGFTEEALDDLSGEFPRIDDRRAGLAHRHGWIACGRSAQVEGGFDALAHFDHQRGTRALYELPRGDRVSEPVFVPRSPDAPEGDGWLLATVWRAAHNRSDLAVFEACDIARGPLALVQLAHRVPAGFHGNWIDDHAFAAPAPAAH